MRNRDFWSGVLIGALAVAVAASGGILGYLKGFLTGESVISDVSHVRKIRWLEEVIDREYLGDIDKEELAQGMYAGLVYGLGDPYSCYYTAEDYQQQSASTGGVYTGIGILMQKNPEGGVEVVECYEGSPAQLAGLMEGDVISAVGGTDVTEAELDEVARLVKECGEGSITLTVHRKNQEEALEIRVSVQDVELPSVFPEMLDGQTGYIRISEFTGVTEEQYRKAFSQLEDQGMEKLVIDLRGNPGGLLTAVCGVLEEILPEGLIVYTEDKNGEREEFLCEGEHPLDIPLAVLVNGESASASEIFAGAVQDYGIGTIVGTTTYGKGVVQGITRFPDGSAVKLTISQYYTPSGRSIHEKGILPDVEVRLDPELLNRDEISHEEDNQLAAALEAIGDM